MTADEVESITSNRSSSMSSNEPGDAVRVVNAVLTSLDALKRRPNVLVLCTSNMQVGGWVRESCSCYTAM